MMRFFFLSLALYHAADGLRLPMIAFSWPRCYPLIRFRHSPILIHYADAFFTDAMPPFSHAIISPLILLAVIDIDDATPPAPLRAFR